MSYENFIFIIIKILLKTNFGHKPSSPISSRSVLSSLSSENQSTERQSISFRFSKFFQSSEFSSAFNRQLYSRLPLISSYRRSLTSSSISFRSPPQSQLEEQPGGQPDGQSGGQSDGQSDGQSENQSVERQSSPIIENPEHPPTIGNSEHVPTTENSKHPDGPPDEPSGGPPDGPQVEPSDGPLVGSSDGSSVEQSFKPSTPSSSLPRPSAPLISVSQSMGQSMRQLMCSLMRRSMNQPISGIHVRCGIG